jgi:hypothetical protein
MIILGFACLGLLVGVLTGLTSSPITTTILASVFALGGGSLVPLVSKSEAERKLLGALLSGFALFCLLGVFAGIYIKVNKTLTLRSSEGASEEVVYLKSAQITEMNLLNLRYRNKEIPADEAYQQLWTLVQKTPPKE